MKTLRKIIEFFKNFHRDYEQEAKDAWAAVDIERERLEFLKSKYNVSVSQQD